MPNQLFQAGFQTPAKNLPDSPLSQAHQYAEYACRLVLCCTKHLSTHLITPWTRDVINHMLEVKHVLKHATDLEVELDLTGIVLLPIFQFFEAQSVDRL